MLTFAFGLILVGSLLLYAGWEGLSLRALMVGDNQTPGQTGAGASRVPYGKGATV
jgi:hypothetical protein